MERTLPPLFYPPVLATSAPSTSTSCPNQTPQRCQQSPESPLISAIWTLSSVPQCPGTQRREESWAKGPLQDLGSYASRSQPPGFSECTSTQQQIQPGPPSTTSSFRIRSSVHV